VIASADSERSLRVLGAEKVRAIHDASLRVLGETGVTMPFEAWREAGRPNARSRARERAREILATHEPEPLRCEQQIREIISARAGSPQ
jgi:trimethylamine:corrinoid methyltransferase-like protein